jgi:hypothetical protein
VSPADLASRSANSAETGTEVADVHKETGECDKGADRMTARGSWTTYRLRGQSGTAFPPDSTALLVIDTVNDFLSEVGAAWDVAKRSVNVLNVIENLRRLLEGARERGVPVLHGPMAYTEEDYAEH